MKTYPLVLNNGHLFVSTPDGSFLLDTGAPTSFGAVTALTLETRNFELAQSYMGLTPSALADLVAYKTEGLLGSDILNQFDILIDVPRAQVCFSSGPLECDGATVELDFVMNVPKVTAAIAGKSMKMFFDSGAQISYLQDPVRSTFPAEGTIADFYPGFGEFSTDTFRVPVDLGGKRFQLRCGELAGLLGMTLSIAGTSGIIGNEVLMKAAVGYFPRRRRLVLS